MARLLTSMWLLLIVSLSSMFFLMGDFLSEQKGAKLSVPAERPYARIPRNAAGDEASVARATIKAEEPVVARVGAVEKEEPSSPQLRDDDLDNPSSLAVPSNTERVKPVKRASTSATPADVAPPGLYRKKIKRQGSLGQRRLGGRFGKRRLLR